MGSGCLGPKKRHGEVYLEIINQIHQSAKKVNPVENLDLYESIKQKINKKGLLRKLMDNLASHRVKIPDSITHNYRIVAQSKTLQTNYAGLIIADSIIAGVYKSQIYSGSKLKKGSTKKSTIYQIKTNGSQQQSEINNSMNFSFQGVKNSSLNQKFLDRDDSIARQIDNRFQLSYLRMMLHLLQFEPRIYYRVLESLENYCSVRTKKTSFTEQIWDILARIGKNIHKKILLQKSVKIYRLLLIQLKDQSKDDVKDSDQFKKFIRMWMKVSIPVLSASNRSENNQQSRIRHMQSQQSQKQRSQQIEQFNEARDEIISEAQKFERNLFEIIKIYVSRSITSWQSHFIYQAIVEIYDQNNFKPKKIQNLEEALLQMIKGQDLNQQFLKGLFLYLLAYVSFTKNEKSSSRWESISWGLSTDMIKNKNRYPNINSEENKINALSLVRRLARDKVIDINQTIAYNSCSLVYAYLFNLYNVVYHSSVCDAILGEFFQMLKLLNQQKKLISIVVQTIFEQLNSQSIDCQRDQEVQKILIKTIRKIIQIYGVNQQKSILKNALQLRKNVPKSIKLQVMQLFSFVCKNTKSKNLEENLQQISDIMYFVYDTMVFTVSFNSDTLLFKHQFQSISMQFIKNLSDQNCFLLLLAYLQKVLVQFYPQQKTKNSIGKQTITPSLSYVTKFFVILHILEVRQIISNTKMPQQVRKIKQKISPFQNRNSNNIGTLSSNHINSNYQSPLQKQIQKFVEQNMNQLIKGEIQMVENIRNNMVMNQQQYEFYKQMVGRSFRIKQNNQGEHLFELGLSSHRSYIRKSSYIDQTDQIDESQDQSFHEIVDIINK